MFQAAGAVAVGPDKRVQYRPTIPRSRAHVQTLDQAYQERPVTLIRVIYALRDRQDPVVRRRIPAEKTMSHGRRRFRALPARGAHLPDVHGAAASAATPRSGVRLLLWSALCFVCLTLNNLLLFVDLAVFTEIDLRPLAPAGGTGSALRFLLYGFLFESE